MVEKSQGSAAEGENAAPVGAPRRPGHRGMDPRDTVAELTAKAHEISQTAGSKVAAAMKEVIGAAAGLTGFAVESARDLIHYMVRRGQMTQMEGDKLLREVEAAHGVRKAAPRADEPPRSRSSTATPAAPKVPKAEKKAASAADDAKPAKKAAKAAAEDKPVTKKATEKPAASKTAAKKTAASGSAKKQSAKGSAARSEAAPRPRAASKPASDKKKKA